MSRHCRCALQPVPNQRTSSTPKYWLRFPPHAAKPIVQSAYSTSSPCRSLSAVLPSLAQARLLVAPPQQQQSPEEAAEEPEEGEEEKPKKKKGPKQPER